MLKKIKNFSWAMKQLEKGLSIRCQSIPYVKKIVLGKNSEELIVYKHDDTMQIIEPILLLNLGRQDWELYEQPEE